MTGEEYQTLAMRTNDGRNKIRLFDKTARLDSINLGDVLNAALGMSGEVGELNDIIKKWVFHEKELDETHLKKELGDVLWYVALMAESFSWSLDEVMELNVAKLEKRYPEGFDTSRANNRKEGDI